MNKTQDLEIQKELENYNDFWNSSRAKAVGAIFFILITTLIGAFFNNHNYLWADITLLIVLTWFIYKGSKIALIIIMFVYTLSSFSKIINLLDEKPKIAVAVFLMWIYIMKIFFKAYKVEKLKDKLQNKKSLWNSLLMNKIRKFLSNLLLILTILFISYSIELLINDYKKCQTRLIFYPDCKIEAISNNLSTLFAVSIPLLVASLLIHPKRNQNHQDSIKKEIKTI
jgi:hypothetical protein